MNTRELNKFRLSEMIGKLRSKMEEERKKIEAKKQKEGFFSDEVNDILTKYILPKLRINSGMAELFEHATQLDEKSNKITNLFNERDKLIRNLTTNLYLLVGDIKNSQYLPEDAKQKILERTESLFNMQDSETLSNLDNDFESLQRNLNTFKINENKRASESRKSQTSPTISAEEMTKLKNRLVTMIKTEQEEKPFKKILKKKLAKYEQRLKNRNIISMKTQRMKDNSSDRDGMSPLEVPKRENEGLTPGINKLRFGRGSTMLRKRKTMTKKHIL